MKGKAMIMMVCLLAYLAGWTSVPRMMQAPVKASLNCCSKTDETAAHKCPKNTKDDKGCADCCMSCPMCYTMIIPVISNPDFTSEIISSLYGDLPIVYIYNYHADIWRPPNKA